MEKEAKQQEAVIFPPEVWEALTAPFAPDEYEWLPKKFFRDSVLLVPYIRKPAIIRRLNEVFGFGGWELWVDEVNIDTVKLNNGEAQVAYASASLRIHKSITFTDWGSSVISQGSDPDSRIKGAATDAIKRVAKMIGIGLHLDMGGDLGFVAPVKDGKIVRYPVLLFDPNGRPHSVDVEMPSPGKGEPVNAFSKEKLEEAKKWLEQGNRWQSNETMTKFYLAVLYHLERK